MAEYYHRCLARLRAQKFVASLAFASVLIGINVTYETLAEDTHSEDWLLSGSVQIRSEADARDFSSDSDILTFTSIRTRLGLSKSAGSIVHFFIQAQDSRVFGSEPNTLSSIGNLDLHQAYLQIDSVGNWPLALQAGRFEMSYRTQRFIGSVGWHFVGRSFDGVRLMYENSSFELDGFSSILRESNGYIGNANPRIYGANDNSDMTFSGLWASIPLDANHELDVFGLMELDQKNVIQNDKALERFTGGLNYFGSFGKVSATVEGGYQMGTARTSEELMEDSTVVKESDIAAFLASAYVQVNANPFTIGAGVDLLSGTDPTATGDDIESFTTPFATNHKFYGHMDYFINIPVNTQQLGLHDFYLKLDWKPGQSNYGLNLMIHQFSSNQASMAGNSSFGQEIDFWLRYNIIDKTNVTFGGSLFLPGDLMKEIFAPGRDDPAFWFYTMLTANL